MSSSSIRLHQAIRQREGQFGEDGQGLPDAGRGSEAAGEQAHPRPFGRLWREDGRLMYQDGAGGAPEAVRVLWARPLSGRGGPVSIMLAAKKKELALLPSPDALPEESRALALEELAASLVLPRITAIRRIQPRFGNYYWDVDTDMGPRKFLITSPENNSLRPAPDILVIRDVAGNCYEIAPVSALDAASRRELDRVL